MTTVMEAFRTRCEFLQRMTLDYANGVPDEHWAFSPNARFAPFCKQLRHVVCVRGVYNGALVSKSADFSKKHSHYSDGLTRAELTTALAEKHEALLAILDTVDTNPPIDFFGRQFSFVDFTYTMVQHEALHHGQWSVYASLAGLETPLSWRLEWAL